MRLVSGEDDRNFFLPAFLLAGPFAAQGETLRPLPKRFALGSLAAQGLDGFAGAVTYHLGARPEEVLIADVGNAFASLWDLNFWLSPRDAENRPGLHALRHARALFRSADAVDGTL